MEKALPVQKAQVSGEYISVWNQLFIIFSPYKCQPRKMVKHTQTIRRLRV